MNVSILQQMQRENISRHTNNPEALLKWTAENLPNEKLVMGTGFGPPGIVLLDMLFKVTRNISVFYIDTGFLFDQTDALKTQLEEKYDFRFLSFSTNLTPEQQEKKYGKELWRHDPDACCNQRKVSPLKKALGNYDVWITGIRKKQTLMRSHSELLEVEPRFGVIKVNPLINWSHDDVWDYIKTHDLPYNPLHDQGYPSIGCTHCTTPISVGDDDRSGRWKGTTKTECGLHQFSAISLDGIKGNNSE